VPGVVAGHYPASACRITLAPLAAAAHVSLVETAAVGLDAAARQVRLADGRVAGYDVLSIDTGSVQHRGRLPGAREHAMYLRPIEHFLALQQPLLGLGSQRVQDIVVVGGGAAGFEIALALQHRLCGQGTERARVALVTGGTPPLAGYPAAVVQRALHVLKARRVTVFQEAAATLEGGALVLSGGARLACDAAVVATGGEPPPWLAGTGLALCERGFVLTGPTLQSRSHPDVFAAGDVATREDLPHPRSGVYAVRAGPPLAENLRRAVEGSALLPYTPPARTLNLLSCGGRLAIAAWGGWVAEGRWAWWWKDRIDRGFIHRFRRDDPPAVTRAA
jgi:NADH dehydrogenase FAD-containing subunit